MRFKIPCVLYSQKALSFDLMRHYAESCLVSSPLPAYMHCTCPLLQKKVLNVITCFFVLNVLNQELSTASLFQEDSDADACEAMSLDLGFSPCDGLQ